MWSATRRSARLVQEIYRMIAISAGPRVLPGRRLSWESPLEAGVAVDHEQAWRAWFGDWDEVAAYVPAQVERSGFCLLLLREGRPVGFTKTRPGWDPTEEISVISGAAGATTYWTPKVIGSHSTGGWTSLGLEPLSGRVHSPRLRSPLLAITEEISERLAGVVEGRPRQPGWVPMHGDLAPWNLRQSGPLAVVFDWEHAGYGPPGADAVFHIGASKALGYDVGPLPGAVEDAIAFWTEEIPRRFGRSDRDQAMAEGILRELGRLG
jgi:hypothetical protein